MQSADSLILYALKGLKLEEYSIEANSFEIVSQLKTGVYILKASLENGQIETQRIIVQ
jgi:hypothetical protein